MRRVCFTLLWMAIISLPFGSAETRDSVGAARLLTGTPEQFVAVCRGHVKAAEEQIARIKALEAGDKPLAALEAYDIAVQNLGDGASRAGLAREVHPDENMRKAAETCEVEIDKASTALSLDRGVYDALTRIDASKLDTVTRFYLQRTLRDFRRAGVDKDEKTRARVKKLRDELVKIGQEFGKNIRSDVRKIEVAPEELEGLPEDYVRAHKPGPAGKVTITSDSPDYIPFMTYARSSAARERLWKTYRHRGYPANLAVLSRMLQKRKELANLLGYPTWADYVTEDKMIASSKNASEFIERIAAASERSAKRDYEELLAYQRREKPDATAVAPWDAGYLQDKLKSEKYSFNSQLARPYFEYARVKQGVLDVTSKLFAIEYRPVQDAPVWHASVETYDVYDRDRLLGRIHLDMHPRENKYKHFAQFTLTNGVGGRALPEGVLVCNFPQPGAEPALMEKRDVETLFHEFGHLVHSVLAGHVKWAGISGISTEWDFVEAPSQLLEEWTWSPEVLQSFARHYKTNEPIPADMVKKMKAADEFGKGLNVRQQMFYAATSLQFHAQDPSSLDTTRLMAELQERYTPYKYVKDTYFHTAFGHLDGYSAIYYTYMWSLVIAKDLYTPFKSAGVMDPKIARAYREKVLAQGGSKPAAEMVRDFLGRDFDFKAYQEWLDSK